MITTNGRSEKQQTLVSTDHTETTGQQVPSRSRLRTVLRLLLATVASIVGVILIGVLVLLIKSPGKLEPLKDAYGNVIPGSISEKVWVEIGGIKQGMFIRGENLGNPLVLYLHGGPGEPMLQFISAIEKREDYEHLEKYFTICYWDQRGSGMTYTSSTEPSSLTLAQMVEDTREVTEYLKTRFGQDKIYLIGQSWGTYLGVKTIEQYPENYLAYIGIGQAVNTTESERLAYDYMLRHAIETNDTEVIADLEKYDMRTFPWFNENDLTWLYYIAKTRTPILNEYGVGRMREGVYMQDILKTFFDFEGYTLWEKINWFLGEDMSMVQLFPVVLRDDLAASSTTFAIPFYIVHGVHDYVTSLVIAEQYFDIVEAPKKGFYRFENSAHSPNLEEPAAFVALIRSIAAENLEEER